LCHGATWRGGSHLQWVKRVVVVGFGRRARHSQRAYFGGNVRRRRLPGVPWKPLPCRYVPMYLREVANDAGHHTPLVPTKVPVQVLNCSGTQGKKNCARASLQFFTYSKSHRLFKALHRGPRLSGTGYRSALLKQVAARLLLTGLAWSCILPLHSHLQNLFGGVEIAIG
jgi:hypothetical protein